MNATLGVLLVHCIAVVAIFMCSIFEKSSSSSTTTSEFKWLHWPLNGGAPPGGVRVGPDSDGSEMYVGRSYYGGDLIPGKFLPDRKLVQVFFGQLEHNGTTLEVIVGSGLSWVQDRHGGVPCNAVGGGLTTNNFITFTGRVKHRGMLIPGVIVPPMGRIFVALDDRDYDPEEYEVLVSESIEC